MANDQVSHTRRPAVTLKHSLPRIVLVLALFLAVCHSAQATLIEESETPPLIEVDDAVFDARILSTNVLPVPADSNSIQIDLIADHNAETQEWMDRFLPVDPNDIIDPNDIGVPLVIEDGQVLVPIHVSSWPSIPGPSFWSEEEGITDLAGPFHGQAAITPDGLSVTYQPDAGYVGYDVFAFEITTTDGTTTMQLQRVFVYLPGLYMAVGEQIYSRATPGGQTIIQPDSNMDAFYSSLISFSSPSIPTFQPSMLDYTDTDGTRVFVSMSNGTAIIRFTGDDLAPIALGQSLSILGSNVQIADIDLNGYIDYGLTTLWIPDWWGRGRSVWERQHTTPLAEMKIGTFGGGGDGLATVERILGNSNIDKLLAPIVNLTGDGIVMSGRIKTIELNDLENGADIFMSTSAPPRFTTFINSTFADRTLFEHSPNSGISTQDSPAALLYSSLPRYMRRQLTPTNKESITLGRLYTDSDVNVPHYLHSFQATSWESGNLNGKSIKNLQIAENMGANINLDADHAKFALHNAQIGSLNDATWDITGNLGNLTVTEDVNNCTIRTTGNMGKLKFKAVIGSDFLAGCGDAVSRHATSRADFENTSKIKSILVVGGKRTFDARFQNSNFSAARIDTVRFKNVKLEPSSDPFGLFTRTSGDRRELELFTYEPRLLNPALLLLSKEPGSPEGERSRRLVTS